MDSNQQTTQSSSNSTTIASPKEGKHCFFCESESDEGVEVVLSQALKPLAVHSMMKKNIKLTRKRLEEKYESYFEILLFRAENLSCSNLTGLADTYVQIENVETKNNVGVISDHAKGKRVSNTTNPEFKQRFIVSDEKLADFNASHLKLSVFVGELLTSLTSYRLVGSCTLSFKELRPGKYVDYTKELKNGEKSVGSLTFSVKYRNLPFEEMQKDCIHFIDRYNSTNAVMGFQKNSYFFIVPNEEGWGTKLRNLLRVEFDGASEIHSILVDSLPRVMDMIKSRNQKFRHVIKFTTFSSSQVLYDLGDGERKIKKTSPKYIEGNYLEIMNKVLSLSWNYISVADFLSVYCPWMWTVRMQWSQERNENICTLGDSVCFYPLQDSLSFYSAAHKLMKDVLNDLSLHKASSTKNEVHSVQLAEILSYVSVGRYPDNEHDHGYNSAARFRVTVVEKDKKTKVKTDYGKTYYLVSVLPQFKVVAEFDESSTPGMDDGLVLTVMNNCLFQAQASKSRTRHE